MTYDFENYKKDSLSKPRNMAWKNWAKFEKVGDKVQGFIRDVFYRPAEGQFQENRGITIEQKDGVLINVGVKRLTFILVDTDSLRIGDPLTVELTELKKSETKGFSATKIFSYYGKNIVEDGKTVKELESDDMKAGGTAAPTEEEEVDKIAKEAQSVDAKDVPFP